MTSTLHQRLEAARAEVARLEAEIAEAEREPRRWWLAAAFNGLPGVYTSYDAARGATHADSQVIPVIELLPGWKLVKDGPFVVTDAVVRVLWMNAPTEGGIRELVRSDLAAKLTRAGIPAVASTEGAGQSEGTAGVGS